jgi:hypothetical protein
MHYRRTLKHGDPATKRKRKYAEDCLIEDCDRTSEVLGYCSAHYQQIYVRGLVPTPVRDCAPMGSMQAIDGFKRCGRCRETLSIEDFPKSKRATDGFAPNCKVCTIENNMIKRFGISGSDKELIWLAQGSRCAASGLSVNETKQVWVIDHCHSTGVIRGVLHPKINAMIGLVGEDGEILRRFMAYIECFTEPESRPFAGSQLIVHRRPAGYWASRDAERSRDGHLRRKFKLSPDDWERLFESQGRACMICGVDKPMGLGWHTDHVHRYGLDGFPLECERSDVRAILCNNCNTALGMIETFDRYGETVMTQIIENVNSYLNWHSSTDKICSSLQIIDKRERRRGAVIVVNPFVSEPVSL